MLQLPASWPFSVKRLPFFYGWLIWFVSTLGLIMSIPGQTMGMAVFTDHFIEALGLSRTQLSIAYLLGTLAGSVFLTRAGRFYDQMGARITMAASSIILGLFLLFIASINTISTFVLSLVDMSATVLTFSLILIGYFGVRFAGQGVLTSAARNVLLVWFEKRRGLVSGARSVFVSLGFSLAPLILALLIKSFGWKDTLLILAIATGLIFSLVSIVFVRDNPESCGLMVDGAKHEDEEETLATIPDLTVSEAKQSPTFWVYVAALSLHSMFGTALVFHIVSIFSEAGRSSSEAFAYFFPQAVVSVSINMLGSWLSDHWPLKHLLLAMLIAFVIGAWGLLHLQYDWGYWLLICGLGTTGGLWGVLSTLAFIRFFGRLYLGEISGLNMTFMVIGSAIGPAMFSIGNDIFGTYHAAIWGSIVMYSSLLIAAIIIKQKEPASP